MSVMDVTHKKLLLFHSVQTILKFANSYMSGEHEKIMQYKIFKKNLQRYEHFSGPFFCQRPKSSIF